MRLDMSLFNYCLLLPYVIGNFNDVACRRPTFLSLPACGTRCVEIKSYGFKSAFLGFLNSAKGFYLPEGSVNAKFENRWFTRHTVRNRYRIRPNAVIIVQIVLGPDVVFKTISVRSLGRG